MRRATKVLLSTVAAVPLLAGCGTDDGQDPTRARATTTSQEPTTDVPVHDPTDGRPAFPDDTAPQMAENSGEWDLVLTDVRVAEHETFDRIVLDFTGTGVPGWTVGYVDEAVLDGSGNVVTLGGDAILDIYASGTTWPAPGYYSGPRQFQPENGGDVVDVHVGGTFEGYTQVLVGLGADPVPFRVFAIANPSRLVVDVFDDRTD